MVAETDVSAGCWLTVWIQWGSTQRFALGNGRLWLGEMRVETRRVE